MSAASAPIVVVGTVASVASAATADRIAAGLRWTLGQRWSGVLLNLLLAIAYLVVAPLTSQPGRDWAVLVGSYFAIFILADVTTTNLLGSDAERVARRLAAGEPLARILLTKNLVTMLVVGLPVLATTALITVLTEPATQLAVTLPAVALPILLWLGVGNLASVTLPVAPLTWRQRWAGRADLRSTARWAAALVLPYVVCLALDPLGDAAATLVGGWWHAVGSNPAGVGGGLLGTGLGAYGLSTGLALRLSRSGRLALQVPVAEGRSAAGPLQVLAHA